MLSERRINEMIMDRCDLSIYFENERHLPCSFSEKADIILLLLLLLLFYVQLVIL